MASKDIIGIGKVLPMNKLVDIISNCFGIISKHYFDKKDIDTEVLRNYKISRCQSQGN